MESAKIGEYMRSGFDLDSSKSFSVDEIDGKELWLIKIPKDLPFESLPNKLQVSDINRVSVKSIDVNKKKYTIHQDDTKEISTLFNVWSKNDNGKMALGKPFTKFIQIDEIVELPKEQITPKPTPKPIQQHNILKGVYDPPGSTGYLNKIKEEEKIKNKNTTKINTGKQVKKDVKKEAEIKKESKDKKEKEIEKKKKKQESSSSSEEESEEEEKDKKKKKSSKDTKKSSSKKSSKKQESSSEDESESEDESSSSSEEEKKSSKKSSSKKSSSKKSSSKKQDSSDEEKSSKKKKDTKRKKEDSETEQTKKKHKK
ncbi:hypothetical protein DICPUDRAFT_89628 [Dictyostelium purpureum]|uniref:Uncharacterized protein n=1 Tax=Dictyostelium purpureum TaxID=5786 RepID=F0ZX28_DICPU|nr:uncharacterized protein DICPUDRAFT_89628 [Dictyostelium purpureum]EGC31500.1 hypothetical protein DICPUDRAFT_89628 [Dictyostelium purpureum]|eukprot:XP_003291975.1 hypothetical protein DICPUDRAFT_89628 [Dictyostelium purpureum]